MIKWHDGGINVSSFKTPLNEMFPTYVLQSLQGHLYVVQDFIFSLIIFSDFALLISLGIALHNFGARDDILSVPK